MKTSMELLIIYIHSLSSCIIHLLNLIHTQRRSKLMHSVSLSLIKISVFLVRNWSFILWSKSYLMIIWRL